MASPTKLSLVIFWLVKKLGSRKVCFLMSSTASLSAEVPNNQLGFTAAAEVPWKGSGIPPTPGAALM